MTSTVAPALALQELETASMFSMSRWEPGAVLGARRALRASNEDRRLLGWMVGDRDRRQVFTSMAFEEYLAETGGEGRLIGFIKWIIENPEKIAALIRLLMEIFGGAAPV